MPRGSTTQTRTFTYSGSLLQSATNPENGTVSYYYNSMNKVSRKHDAKGQDVVYTYDSIGRLTQTQKYPTGIANAEDVCQQENYYYDTNPFDSMYSGQYTSGTAYTSGRLTAVQYYGGSSAYYSSSAPGANCDTTFQEMYSYTQAGGKIGKRLRVVRSLPSGFGGSGGSPSQWIATNANLDSAYTFDNEGRITAMQYPSYGPTSSPTAGPDLGYAVDSMGRLNTMTDLGSSSTIIIGATYGPSNELLSMSGSYGESRTYNSMRQLTQLSNGSVNITYNYSSTQNNGKITSQTDNISGETVVYTYDSLNRLASAGATSSSWGQSYGYDGFGNLTAQTVTAGSAPAYSVTPDPTTNHLGSTDANGNSTDSLTGGYPAYDVMNRLVAVGSQYAQYSYASGNKRVWRGIWTSGSLTTDEVTFWSITGQKLATYSLTVGTTTGPCYPATYLTCFYGTMTATQATTNYYFGKKLIKNANGYVGADRLGSIGKYYPYGQEKPSATTNGTEKFTGYMRDSETGLDYAKNRYHNPGTGRFLTVDPYRANSGGVGDPMNPMSWNKYAYTGGDPINRVDPGGLDWVCTGPEDDQTCHEEGPQPTTDECFGANPDPSCSSDPVEEQANSPNKQRTSYKSPFPQCNSNGDPSKDANLAAVVDLYDQANAAASVAGVPVSWVLGWAYSESGFSGSNPSSFAGNNGNFFSLTGSGSWGGIPCGAGTTPGYACFASFQDSAIAAFTSSSNLLTLNGKTGVSVDSIIQSVQAANPNASVAQIFQTIANDGFDPKGSSTNKGYGGRAASTINKFQGYLDCLQANGYI